MTTITQGVSVTGTVRAPAQDAWSLIRCFGAGLLSWWQNARAISIDGEQDVVGCVRTYRSVSGFTYRERLVSRDDEALVLRYELLESTPRLPLSVTTTIALAARGQAETVVTWSSDIVCSDPGLLAQAKASQAKVYAEGIRDLDQHFRAQAELVKAFEYLKHDAVAVLRQLVQAEGPRIEYDRYGRLPWMPEVALEDLPRLARGLPPSALISPKILGAMVERQFEYVAAQRGYAPRMEQVAATKGDPYRVPFQPPIDVPAPVLARNALEVDEATHDAELCRQLLQGANPHVIARVVDPAGLPPGLQQLAQRARAKRLYVCDYARILDVGDPAGIKARGYFEYRGMVLYAPILLLHQPSKQSDLRILGIQLTRHDDAPNEVYTPGSSTPNRYRLAKMHVACADMQYQEWIYHLGLAHLCSEPLAIATHNALGQAHPIGRLLAPHFADTIGINFLARRTLVSPVTPLTDRVFATGCAGALKMVLGAWKDYHFLEWSFPGLLEARGFVLEPDGDLGGYYYRDDGAALWKAIASYARAVVDALYRDDAAVAADQALAAWALEASDPDHAGIPGFPGAFPTKALLARTLTTALHNASAMHAVVNYTQLEYQGYLLNRSPCLVKAMPPGSSDIPLGYLLEALPGPYVAHFQAMFSHILTMSPLAPLTETTPIAGSNQAQTGALRAAHARFKRALDSISKAIRTRNAGLAARGEVPYPHLDPAIVPSSVAI